MHGVQVTDPARAKVPTGHVEQAVPPAALTMPAGHVVHMFCAAAEVMPGAHAAHDVLAPPIAKVPGAQLVHWAAPALAA